jgi:hypothetical protein
MTPTAPVARMSRPPTIELAIVAEETITGQLLFLQLVAVVCARAVSLAATPVVVPSFVPAPEEKNVIDNSSTVG